MLIEETEYLCGIRARIVVMLTEALRCAQAGQIDAESFVGRVISVTEWCGQAEREVSEHAAMMRSEERLRCLRLVSYVRDFCRRQLVAEFERVAD